MIVTTPAGEESQKRPLVWHYRTWCGTYSPAYLHVLVGWIVLLLAPPSWRNALRMQRIEGWNWPVRRLPELPCECSVGQEGGCFRCYLYFTLAHQPYPEAPSTPVAPT